jgi:uncharacterized protein
MSYVTTQGTANACVRPDSATVGLTLTHVADGPAAALTIVSERSKTVEILLGELTIDNEDWTTGGVSVAEEWQWLNDTNTLVGHRASVSISVKLKNLDTIGTLISEATTRVGAQVSGPSWVVDRSNPRWDELFAEAAGDARRRALAYAGALGLRIGKVTAISEMPITEVPAGAGYENAGGMLKSRSSMAMDGAVSVNPGQVELSTGVYVRFSLLDGE